MSSFLITFKPATENPEQGWPLEKLLQFVKRQDAGERIEEEWRFHNRKEVSLGDRVFLLLQGKSGPAIIGYGSVAGMPTKNSGKWRALIKFQSLVDPTSEALANREDLLEIDNGRRLWATQSSGVKLPEAIASELEALIVGKLPKSPSESIPANPDWTRDELILALNVYLKHRPNPPGKGSQEIRDLSESLNRLGQKLFSPESRGYTFRNENGVYMKLMNLRRLDPEYTADGRRGLSRGAKAEEEVWAEFADDPLRCQNVAEAIISALNDPEVGVVWTETGIDEGIQEAPEGRLLTRTHMVRERSQKLVESKRKQSLKRNGKLTCEICNFDFAATYGTRGSGFIECHHTRPVATLAEGHKTHIDDLALVCANCHRMIHWGKKWLLVGELKALLRDDRS